MSREPNDRVSSPHRRITLPDRVLSDADMDEKSIGIIARERGLADRFNDFVATHPDR